MTNAENNRLEMESYLKTPEYRVERVKELKIELRKKAVEKDVLVVDESTELQFKDKEVAKKWKQWVRINSEDPYDKAVVTFARRWAKYMQHLMEKHNKTVGEIAHNALHASNIEDISGAMYECAVSALVHCWKYGEELFKWYNRKYDM